MKTLSLCLILALTLLTGDLYADDGPPTSAVPAASPAEADDAFDVATVFERVAAR